MGPFFRSLALASLAMLLMAPAFAAELNDAEVLLENLEKLETTKARSLAKRWEGLIRLRQWNSASGKHSTYGKYVGHAPDLSSIQLLVLVPNGEERTEKLVDVPIEKLDKSAQTLLKRIAKAREAVEELVGESAATEDESNSTGEPRSASQEYARAERTQDSPQPSEQRKRPGLDSFSIRPIATNDLQKPDLNTPVLPDNAAWRTSYDAFIKNFSSIPINPEGDVDDMSNWKIEWGNLQDLRWQWELLSLEVQSRNGQVTREQSQEIQAKSNVAVQRIGEVMWTGMLDEDLPQKAGNAIYFKYLYPPDPFDIVFTLDKDFEDSVQPFKKGEQVKFIGRFKSFGIGTPAIIIHIRFPEDQSVREGGGLNQKRFESLNRGLPKDVEESLRKRIE